MKTMINNIKTKSPTLNKTQTLIAERKAAAKAKQPAPKPKKDKSEAKAAYAEAKEMGIDYNKYKGIIIAERRKNPNIALNYDKYKTTMAAAWNTRPEDIKNRS